MSPVSSSVTIVGRQREIHTLEAALAAAREGNGGLLLVPGEAGVGKTHLIETVLASSGLSVLTGRANVHTTAPYGPITAVLRAFLRQTPGGLTQADSQSTYLAYLSILLPELGPAPAAGQTDRATLLESIRYAFEVIAVQPTAIFLDDLQWADNATFEFLPRLVEFLPHLPLLVVATYRSDEIPRGHPMRRLRTELRRLRQLRELPVAPLDKQATAELAARLLGGPLSPALTTALYNRTQGIPLFVEELTTALAGGRHVRPSKAGLELVPGGDVPIPETLRDAVLLRLDGLTTSARKLLETASILGQEFDLALASALGCELCGDDSGFDELFDGNWLTEIGADRAAFRHALTHEAVYNQIPWTARRAWHRELAMRLTAQQAPPQVIAEHWLAAREFDLARQMLLETAEASCKIHAYHDAANSMHRALELWPKGVDEARRLQVLDELGRCSQLSGNLNDAILAWREVAERRTHEADTRAAAVAHRQLATAYELQGLWEQALAARQTAANGFAASGALEEAAAERLSAAAHLRSAGRFRATLDLLAVAEQEVAGSNRWDLKARILGLQGSALGRMGSFDIGVAKVRAGLSLALEHDLSAPAAEIYQRLADVLEHAGDYAGAKATYREAFDFCQMSGAPVTGQICKACLTAVLFHTGEWEQAIDVCRDVLVSPSSPAHALAVGNTILGLIYALRGQASRAKPLLLEAHAIGTRIELAPCELLSTWGQAVLETQTGNAEAASEHCRALIKRWLKIEDRHYVIAPLVWATTHFAAANAANASADVRACANALATIASSTGHAEALSALAYALGEVAALDGDIDRAIHQFAQSIELLHHEDSPLERVEAHLRAGQMHAALGQRDAAVEHWVQAYRGAEKLGIKSLADQAAQGLAAFGEKMDRRLGRRAAGKLETGGLTRRQIEILQWVARGQTNQEIARGLTLSPRTVEMHVADILTRLDCHTRTEAVHKANALNLLKIP